MKRAARFVAAIASLCLLARCAMGDPSTQPSLPPGLPSLPAPANNSLPPGHPALPQESSPQLPAGHPAIPQDAATRPALPPGHPQVPTDMPGLPSGHPDLSKLQAPSAEGMLSVKAIQKTPGGKMPAGDVVTIELYLAGQLLNSAEAKLDAKGETSAGNVPIGTPCQPLVKVIHSGVIYQVLGDVLDSVHPSQNIEVPVYEASDEQPKWSMKMRHVVLASTIDGLSVTEMIALESTGDHAWLGVPGKDGKRVTLDIPLPADAKEIRMAGALHAPDARIVDGHVLNSATLVPGSTKMQISYLVPLKDWKGELTITAPAETGHTMIFAPEDGTSVTGDGMTAAGSTNLGTGPMRFFTIKPMTAGKALKITVSGKPNTGGKQPQSRRDDSRLPMLVGGGSVAVLVGGLTVIFLRPAKVVTAEVSSADRAEARRSARGRK